MIQDRLLEINDSDKLRSLYKNAFGLTVRGDYVQAKFFAPYQRIKGSYISAVSDDKIVSFYGIICQRASFKNREFYIGQSCDSMTHKEYGGKGLFVNLAQKVYSKMAEEGVNYIYGFPNETIYNLRIKKLNWQHLENINLYKFKISTLPLAKLCKKMPFLKGFYEFYLTSILSKYKSGVSFFKNSVIDEETGGVVHDADYFEYKSSSDKFLIQLNNIHFWIKIDGYLWVGDFEHTDIITFKDALSKLKQIAKLAGCDSIVFRYQEGTRNDRLLSAINKPAGNMPLGFLKLGTSDLSFTLKFSGSDFDTW